MWNYEKRLEYPINIKNPNPTLAAMIISQYGGPDGESGAAMRYLSQRYSMPYREVSSLLTDIGTEELNPRLYRCIIPYIIRKQLFKYIIQYLDKKLSLFVLFIYFYILLTLKYQPL